MKKLFSDRRGATSVLVIFMMIVLVVFATLAFTTSYANYTLSQRASVITQENYALDALAMRMTLKVDSALASAEARAQEAMRREGVSLGRIEGFTLSQGEVVRQKVAADPGFLSELMDRLYLTYAVEELGPLLEEYDGLEILYGEEYPDGNFLEMDRAAPDGDALKVTLALTTGEKTGDKQLDVVLAVEPLRYSLTAGTGGASGSRPDDFLLRYRVDAWKQWQIPFEYDDSIQFGDARISFDD